MLDKLGRENSISERKLGDYNSAIRHFGKNTFFLLENAIYVLKDEFIHPGGQFILPRIDRSHITKYYFGIAPLSNLPYSRMIHNHSEQIPSDMYKAKMNMFPSSLWVEKHSNLVMRPSSWKNDYSWKVWKVLQLSKVHVLFLIKPKNVAIDMEELEKSVNNFGKIFLCHFKHTSEYKHSFLHLSHYEQFANKRKVFYHEILHKSPIEVFQKVIHRQEGLLINFSKSKSMNFIQSDIQNKFSKKYYNLIMDEISENKEYKDYLPIILKLKDRRKFFNDLSKADSTQLKTRFTNKINEPMELTSKIKLSLGGPFGFENIIESKGDTVLFIDNDGIFALDDFSYGILNSMYALLSSNEPEDKQKHEANLSIKLHIIFKTKFDKLDTFTEFLLAFYFYEQATNRNFLKSLFVFTNDELLKSFIADHSYILATAQRHIISAKYKNGHFYFKQIKKLVDKHKIMFI